MSKPKLTHKSATLAADQYWQDGKFAGQFPNSETGVHCTDLAKDAFTLAFIEGALWQLQRDHKQLIGHLGPDEMLSIIVNAMHLPDGE